MLLSLTSQIAKVFSLTAIFTLLVLLNTSHACDWCNNQFFMELNSDREGTLVADELLASIRAQHDFEELAARAQMETSASASASPSYGATPAPDNFIDIIERDNNLEARPTGFVPQDTEPDERVRITLSEGDVYLGNGVMYEGFTIDGSIPGPTIRVQEGDIVEFTVVNNGSIDHGASIHTAYTQTSKYLGAIAPGDSSTVVFQANHPGVYMYHCAPGGHAIPMHVILGQYGMMVVEPRQKFKLEEELGRGPDVEIDITQHEIYASGKDAVTGQGHPLYTTFNGKLFRYVEEPIMAKPGTTVTWVNEDVFSYMEGEFSGVHNAVATSGPDIFSSPLLTHGESFSFTFEEIGEYEYICTPHPYMKGIVNVSEPSTNAIATSGVQAAPAGVSIIALVLAAFAAFLGFIAMIKRSDA